MSWSALEATWRQHAKTAEYRRVKNQALHAIDDALRYQSRRWMVGMSGGKDSLAMAWMLKCHGAGNDMMFAHAACEFLCDGMTSSAQESCEKLNVDLDVFDPDWSPHEDGWSFLRSLPSAVSIYHKDLTGEIHRRCASGNMLVAYQYANDYTGCFSGVRADESRGRRMNRMVRGSVYRLERDDTVMAQPIVDWRARDVWAAVYEAGLSVPPHYRAIYERFQVSPESPRSRVDSLFVTERVNTYCGAMHVTRVLYPQLWRRLVDARPELGNEA